jgi:hypothetical protein
MKKLSSYILIGLVTLFSCAKDETLVKLSGNGKPAVITTKANDLNLQITSETVGNSATINWDKADYGVNTEVTYTVELDYKCNNFSSPVSLGSSVGTSFSFTLDNLNQRLLSDLKLVQYQTADIELRVVSVINNQYSVPSASISLSLTPFIDKPHALWLLSDKWDKASAPSIYITGASTYEGYVNFSDTTNFKFSNAKFCETLTYASAGTAGALSTDATASSIGVKKGYYKINVDTENLTYVLTWIDTWGLIGTATAGGWNTSTPLTYNATKDVWEASTELVAGALKFRANNGWDINYGTNNIDNYQDSLVFDAAAVNITKTGAYSITLDFSKAKAPYVYKYNIVYTGDISPPARLWVPGGYEGFDPASAPFLSELVKDSGAYEGYINIPSSTGIKFTNAPDYSHTNYGDGGTSTYVNGVSNGSLSTSGADIDWPHTGFFKFNVDTNDMSYTATLINTWGLIGTSTSGGWNTSTPMTYDVVNNVWSVKADLVNGALKFRANDGWDINFGPESDELSGSLIHTDNAITIPSAGNYTITLDFSRATSPYQYSYTVVKN